MRIISKLSDFYDHIGVYSASPIWVRKPITTYIDVSRKSVLTKEQMEYITKLMKKLPKPLLTVNGRRVHNHGYYLVLLIAARLDYFFVTCYNDPTKDIDYFIEVMSKRCDTAVHKRGFFNKFDSKSIDAWYNEFNNEDRLTQIHLALKSPLLLLQHGNNGVLRITSDPHLKSMSMHKVLDGWELYQSIEMFLSNQMAENAEMSPDFGDEIKRDYHGMDKWSFKIKQNIKRRKQKKGKIKK
jgi:hypothetical protein